MSRFPEMSVTSTTRCSGFETKMLTARSNGGEYRKSLHLAEVRTPYSLWMRAGVLFVVAVPRGPLQANALWASTSAALWRLAVLFP